MSAPVWHVVAGHLVFGVRATCGVGCHGWCVDGHPCHAPGVVCVVCGVAPEGFEWPGRGDVAARFAL